MISKLLEHTWQQLIAFVFTTIFGAILATGLFFVTSPPTSSVEVRTRITDLALKSVQPEIDGRIAHITLDYFSSESLDLSASSSEFVFGTATTEDGEIFRFLGIFQPSTPSLIDRLVGRAGFIQPTYVAVIPAADDVSAVLSNVEITDIDLDGNKEIFVTISSTRADNVPTGLIILKKDRTDTWNAIGISQLDGSLKSLISANEISAQPTQEGSFVWFKKNGGKGRKLGRSREQYTQFSVSEEPLEFRHSGKTLEFSMLQNGGRIELLTHPEDGYAQLGVVASITDDEGVLEDHHLMVAFFRIEEKQIAIDPAWNWGRPMLSLDTEDISGIDLKEFQSKGTEAHVVDGTFYSPNAFQRSIPSK